MPELWQTIDSDEYYLDTRVVEILEKYLHKVWVFKAPFKYEYSDNTRLNHMLFSMYNIVKLNLAGCEIIWNVDFPQIMSRLRFLDLSNCPGMSTTSMI